MFQAVLRTIVPRLPLGIRSRLSLWRNARLVRQSSLFDEESYLYSYPDIARAGYPPLAHYFRSGAREGRDPNPLFDTDWYLAQYPEVAAAGSNPLVHYLRFGWRHGYNPNPLFDNDWYLDKNPGLAKAGINPLSHYLTRGSAKGQDPNPCFDSDWYLAENPEVAAAGINPLAHYLRTGAGEGRNPSPDFDTQWYLERYPDVDATDIAPLVHYLRYGAAEARAPNPRLDVDAQRALRAGQAVGATSVYAHFRLQTMAYTELGTTDEAEFTLTDLFEAHGAYNDGWYGSLRLENHQRMSAIPELAEKFSSVAEQGYERGTREIIKRYYPDGDPHFKSSPAMRYGPVDEIEDRSARAAPTPHVSSGPTRYLSLVTPFFRHLNYFEHCAKSVADMAARADEDAPHIRFEWVVINDDPAVSSQTLMECIPDSIRDWVRVLGDGENHGITRRLNQAIKEATGEWIVFLDCDDMLAPTMAAVLDFYIEHFPRCRYISSGMMDIDENNRLLRYRRHHQGSHRLLRTGMIAGHLKAIRRDLFADIGLLDVNADGCQDYDFALRAALQEPLLFIPEYLYCYRWHGCSQSVRKIDSQNQLTEKIRRRFMQRFVQDFMLDTDRNMEASSETIDENGASPLAITPTTDSPFHSATPKPLVGACIVRTQGKRLGLLEETLQSIIEQSIPMVPIVVVHGDAPTARTVDNWIRAVCPEAVCLHAEEPGRRRGYPVNIGLDYIHGHQDRFDYVCFLDDDDIYYPLFAERIHQAFTYTDADIVYSQSARREPWIPATAGPALLPAICLTVQNFITINSFAVRTSVIIARSPYFDEDMEYLEDWRFLQNLLRQAVKFLPLFETLSEFRIFGDGNIADKRHPELFTQCQQQTWEQGKQIAAKVGLPEFYRQLLEFDFNLREPLHKDEYLLLQHTKELFTRETLS